MIILRSQFCCSKSWIKTGIKAKMLHWIELNKQEDFIQSYCSRGERPGTQSELSSPEEGQRGLQELGCEIWGQLRVLINLIQRKGDFLTSSRPEGGWQLRARLSPTFLPFLKDWEAEGTASLEVNFSKGWLPGPSLRKTSLGFKTGKRLFKRF